MLDLKVIRQNPDVVETALKNRNYNFDLSELLSIDEEARSLRVRTETIRAERNVLTSKIAKGKRTGEDVTECINLSNKLAEELDKFQATLVEKEEELHKLLHIMPNIPHESVPIGPNEEHNAEIKRWGDIRRFSFEPLAHWDLGVSLDILDMERGAKIAGSRFPVLKGMGARLERALVNFMLDIHTKKQGYTEVFPPFLVNEKSAFGTGQLPKFQEDMFKVEGSELYLIPTAEVPVTNLFRDEILQSTMLPVKYAAYSACFRSEAGSAGKDTRGIIRNHQFNKVELVHFTRPEDSFDSLEQLTRDAEEVLETLEIPYRRIVLCTGDMGFASAKTYDLEVWLPSYGAYKEISSCSNFMDFQSRRAGIRFKREPKSRPEFVHTLNGSGVAVGRTWAAVVENFQNEDGSISIPKALVPYMDGITRIG